MGAALATGTFGSLLGNGADVVKVRMQVDPSRYSSALAGMRTIAMEEGASALLLRGLAASVGRGAVISVAELVTYDQTKGALKRLGAAEEGMALHVGCSLFTGLVASSCAAPLDLIKTLVSRRPSRRP